MDDDDRDYEIGFGKPPRYTRFRKGQPSPNPKGRPRKPRPAPSVSQGEYDKQFREVLNQQVTIRDATGIRKMSKQRALQEKRINMALAGNVHAVNAVSRDIQDLEHRETEAAQAKLEKERESFRFWCQYRLDRQRVWDAATKEGREPDRPWPHPDDILIDMDKGTFDTRGPLSLEDVPLFEWISVLRDCYYTRAEISLGEKPLREGTYLFWDFLWKGMDALLPLRWQISPVIGRVAFGHGCRSLRHLRQYAKDREKEAQYLEKALGLRRSKETYRVVNGALKPYIQQLGFRSLAELERSVPG